MGLVQRIDDVLLRHNVLEVWCPVRVEIPKYNCLQLFYGIMWMTSSVIVLAYCAARSHDAGKIRCWLLFLLGRDWTLVTSCLEPLNSATDGPAEHLKISEWSSCWVSELGEDVVYSTLGRLWLNHDRWYEIMIRAVFLRRVRRFIVVDFVWRKRIEYEIAASFSDEVSQQGVLRPQIYGSSREVYGRRVFGI